MTSPNFIVCVIILLLVWAAVVTAWLLTVNTVPTFNPCHPGYKVTIGGEYVGCTNDERSPYNVWVPE